MFYKLMQSIRMNGYSSAIVLSYHTTEQGARTEMARQECRNRKNGYKVAERTDNGTFMANDLHRLDLYYLPCNFMN